MERILTESKREEIPINAIVFSGDAMLGPRQTLDLDKVDQIKLVNSDILWYSMADARNIGTLCIPIAREA